ncbi:hypothetical protein RB195_003973 [Necator americanus]|uniref:C6 domain-containing protein n=1 Tax=Necator americanus TaxID=51031 RepID=A0ABR1DR35_NECAM
MRVLTCLVGTKAVPTPTFLRRPVKDKRNHISFVNPLSVVYALVVRNAHQNRQNTLPLRNYEAVEVCGQCLPRWVTYYKSPGSLTNITPVKVMRPNSVAGCRRMSIICTTPPNARMSFMTFNGSFDGPYANINATVLLECKRDKKWHIIKNTRSFFVTSVRCFWD